MNYWKANEDSNELTCNKRQNRRTTHARPKSLIAMETDVPMKAVRNSCEHGLGEVASRIPGHECAVAGPGRGSGKGGKRTCGSEIYPGSDGGIGTKPVDMSKDNHLLRPFRIPDNMGGFAVTGGDVDGDEQGAGVTSRCGIPTRAVRGQPGGFCKNLKRDRVKSRPRIDRLGPCDAWPREGNRKTNENYENVNEQSPPSPQALRDVASRALAGIASVRCHPTLGGVKAV